jgi:NADPH:quinone reductase-like Zn-dependent oxidoreductase
MKAAVIHRWGSPDVFEIVETNQPIPGADQVLIKVIASGLNPVDWKHRKGNHKYMLGQTFPIILGYDVSGEVVETGANISTFKKGDLVFGDLDNKYGGGLAEYAIGSEHCFAKIPANCDPAEAAAYPLVSLTVLRAFRDKANLQKGQTVLINGASGGVGYVAVQMAKLFGANVIAVASSRNKELIEHLNPDKFIDYTKSDLLEANVKVDLFFDVAGNYSFLKTKRMLNKGGMYLSTLPRPKILVHKMLQVFTANKKVKTVLRKHRASDMKQIAQWISEGKLEMSIDQTFNIDQIKEAHHYSEKGKTQGKCLILIQSKTQEDPVA